MDDLCNPRFLILKNVRQLFFFETFFLGPQKKIIKKSETLDYINHPFLSIFIQIYPF